MKLSKKLVAASLEELIEKYNPFGLKEPDGEIKLFSDRRSLYEYFVKHLEAYCHRGYVDIPLLMHRMTQMPFNDCRNFVKHYAPTEPDVTLINWEDENDTRREITNILKMFHNVSETPLDVEALHWVFSQHAPNWSKVPQLKTKEE